MNAPKMISADSASYRVPALSVVIPFFNEQDNIEPLLTEVEAALAPVGPYEIVAVDDGSTDATHSNLEQLAHRLRNLSVVTLRHNRGQSIALAKGIRAAKAAVIVTLDGDGQNPPNEIPALLQAYHATEAPRLVVGWRQKRDDTAVRRLSSRVANNVRRGLLQDDCPDTGCGMKVFERRLFLALPQFDHMHRFLPALFRRAGCQVINVPVAHRSRVTGQSKYGVHNRLWAGLVDLAGVYWLLRRYCPVDTEPQDV